MRRVVLLLAVLFLAGSAAAAPSARQDSPVITILGPTGQPATGLDLIGHFGVPYSIKFQVAGGLPPYHWLTFAEAKQWLQDQDAHGAGFGTIPCDVDMQVGATLTSSGNTAVWSATFSSTGQQWVGYPFVGFCVFVEDSSQSVDARTGKTTGAHASSGFGVTVQPAPNVTITISPDTLPVARVGTPYSLAFAASGGKPPYRYTVPDAAAHALLDAGLKLNAKSGFLSGTPTKAGTIRFALTAADASGATGKHGYALDVLPKTGKYVADLELEISVYWTQKGGFVRPPVEWDAAKHESQGIEASFTVHNRGPSASKETLLTFTIQSPSERGIRIITTALPASEGARGGRCYPLKSPVEEPRFRCVVPPLPAKEYFRAGIYFRTKRSGKLVLTGDVDPGSADDPLANNHKEVDVVVKPPR